VSQTESPDTGSSKKFCGAKSAWTYHAPAITKEVGVLHGLNVAHLSAGEREVRSSPCASFQLFLEHCCYDSSHVCSPTYWTWCDSVGWNFRPPQDQQQDKENTHHHTVFTALSEGDRCIKIGLVRPPFKDDGPHAMGLFLRWFYNASAISFTGFHQSTTGERWRMHYLPFPNSLEAREFLWEAMQHMGVSSQFPDSDSAMLHLHDIPKEKKILVLVAYSHPRLDTRLPKPLRQPRPPIPLHLDLAFQSGSIRSGMDNAVSEISRGFDRRLRRDANSPFALTPNRLHLIGGARNSHTDAASHLRNMLFGRLKVDPVEKPAPPVGPRNGQETDISKTARLCSVTPEPGHHC
jgi:hypothetical protein